ERVVTVWAAGWRGRALALPLVIEIAYDVVLQAVYVKSLIDIASGRTAGWNYVPRETVPQPALDHSPCSAASCSPPPSSTPAGSRRSPPSSRATPSSTRLSRSPSSSHDDGRKPHQK